MQQSNFIIFIGLCCFLEKKNEKVCVSRRARKKVLPVNIKAIKNLNIKSNISLTVTKYPISLLFVDVEGEG